MKKYLKIAAVVISILGLADCQKQENNTISQEKQQEINNDINNSDMYNGNNLCLVTSLGELSNSPGCITSDGFYELYDNNGEDESTNILYTDFATGQRIYLSNSSTASHISESDTSYIKETLGGVELFDDGKSLFILTNGMDSYGADVSQSMPGCLYRSDLDGQNRKLLTTFDGDYEAPTSNIVSDGTYLYMLSALKDSGQTVLVSLNLDTGDIKTIKELGYDVWFIVGAYEDKLIMKTIAMPEKTDEISYEDLFYEQEHIISLISLSDLSEQEIMRWKQDEVVELYSDSRMYYLSKNEVNKLMVIDCKTGSKSEVVDLSNIEGIDADYLNSRVLLTKLIDYKIIIESYLETGDIGYAYAVDIKDGNINTIYILKNDLEVYRRRLPYILGEWEDRYLVIADMMSIPRQMYAPDGSTYMGEYQMNELAFIKKDDYWQGNFEMEKVEDIFLEEIKADTLCYRNE